MEEVYLKILSDMNCEVYIDSEMMAVAPKNICPRFKYSRGILYSVSIN